MKKTTSLFKKSDIFSSFKSVLIFLVIVLISSCSADTIVDENFNEQSIVPSDYLRAMELVREFSASVNGFQTRSSIAIEIGSGTKQTFYFDSNKAKRGVKSTHQADSANLFTFLIKVNGRDGFAIASGDEKVKRVYAYCEYGSLSDTTFIEGLAQRLAFVPYAFAHDLDNSFYEDNSPQGDGFIKKKFQYGAYLETIWGQKSPFNLRMNFMDCYQGDGESNGRALVGCGAVAVGQAIAYYEKAGRKSDGREYDFFTIKRNRKPTDFSSEALKNELSIFLRAVADGLYSKQGCGSTSSIFKNYQDLLRNWGYSFKYQKIKDVDRSLLYSTLQRRDLVLSSGISKKTKGGHAWVMDGIRGYTQFGDAKITEVHCNWGWSGYGDGWYVDYNMPTDGDKLIVESPYLAENRYIYFMENK